MLTVIMFSFDLACDVFATVAMCYFLVPFRTEFKQCVLLLITLLVWFY